jgi:glycosyltransferase involved in cell wall biosynthesis
MNIKYCGPAKDYSGYGEAVRHDIGALVSAGIELTTEIPKYTMELSDFGLLGQKACELEDKKIDYRIKILHITPNVYANYFEAGKYHIGRVFWETDKLPAEFANNVQMLDEIWTGSKFNENAIRKAGVTKPIYIIPEAIDTNLNPDNIMPYAVTNNDTLKFYSMFEWTERKNPNALLTAFWTEFGKDENVSLTIKTYVDNFTKDKQTEIENNIKMLRKRLNLVYYPPVYLFKELMDRHQIYRFHKTFDCFVSTHRGEGWGIPQMEAMLMGRPVISTNIGGIHEYLTDKVTALLLPNKLIPLTANTRNQQWYTRDQNWADINIEDVRVVLRWVYNNQMKVKKIGEDGCKLVREKFSLQAVGELMKRRLLEIEEKINGT